MSIFGDIQIEKVVQVNDKTRLDCGRTFITKDEAAITLIEIEPSAAVGFIDITGTDYRDWWLDYSYATDGDHTISLRVTTDGAPQTFTETISIISIADDKLFSDDSDITFHYSDVLSFIPAGRNSFIDMHRRAQDMILAWLDERGYTNYDGSKITKDEILDTEEVRQWSTFLTLRLIMEKNSNVVEDVFDREANRFRDEEYRARNRAILRTDLSQGGTITSGEGIGLDFITARRR